MSVQTVEEQAGHSEQASREEFRIPVPRYTVAIIACITAVFAAQLWVDRPRAETLSGILFFELIRSIEAAGLVKPAFLYRGEYWRLLTSAFLHGFIVHYAMNCYAFYSFGKLFELLSDRAHLAIVFLLSAVGGGLLSTYFLPFGTSVGASGGIVGLISYLLVYAFRRRQFVSKEFRKSLIINIGFILVFGLVLYSIVDNWGHIGGLLAGAIYGLIQIPGDPYRNPQEAHPVTKVLGLTALGICIAVACFSIYLILLG